jgi:hypothetical protein
MYTRNNFVIALALGAIILAFSTSIAIGQTEPPEPGRAQVSFYGMHFISGGQTMRVTVQNPRLSDPDIIPCIRVRVLFDVYEAAGDGSVRLRFARRVSRELELDAGEAATLDFPSSRSGDWISPTVSARCEENCPSDPTRVRVLSTAAIRQGGSTVLLLPAVLRGFDPQPDPPAARPQ